MRQHFERTHQHSLVLGLRRKRYKNRDLITILSYTESIPIGKRLVSASEDKTLKVWQEFLPGNQEGIITEGNEPTWKCVSTLSGYHERAVYSVDWSHVTGWIASAAGDDSIRVFKESISGCSAATNFELAVTKDCAHTQDVNCVAWNPKIEGLLASCSDDGLVKLWQISED